MIDKVAILHQLANQGIQFVGDQTGDQVDGGERFGLRLPVEPFRYYQYGERVVHLDGCVEVEAAYYGAPPGWIGRVVRVQWDEVFVRLLDPKTGQLLREHVRQKRGWYRIKPEDHSKRTPLRTSQLLWRAGRAGTHIGTLCEAIHRQQGEVGVRRILGVLSLAKKYGAAAVDEACAAALEMGVQEYRFVRRYLERCPQAPLSLQQNNFAWAGWPPRWRLVCVSSSPATKTPCF